MRTAVAFRPDTWTPIDRKISTKQAPRTQTWIPNLPLSPNSTLAEGAFWESFLLDELQPTFNLWPNKLQLLIAELGDLQPGWVGEATVPPEKEVLDQIAFATSAFDDTVEPTIEVDPSDGEVSFVWSSSGRSLTMTFARNKEVIVIETDLERPTAQPITRLQIRSREDVLNLARHLADSPLAHLVHPDASVR